MRRGTTGKLIRLIFLISILGSIAQLGLSRSGQIAPAATASADGGIEKGISFSTWWSGQYVEPGSDLSLQRLADTGAEWISLIVTGHQATPSSTTIDFTGPATPTDNDLVHVIELAHQLGLKVMLKPHLDLLNEEENNWWRGHIGTEFILESQWSAWFAAYAAFIEHYAALAASQGVDQFCVGTELLGTSHREAEWRQVVTRVRTLYSGPLTYAALHSGEESSITWWDAVDYIGVDAYYPLFSEPDLHPTIADLEASWTEPIAILAELSARFDRQILLTEIGYRSQHGCARHPWDSLIESDLDPEEQAFAYEAAFRQLFGQPWLAGMFWWSWHADPYMSGPCDAGYSPHQKPAENVLRTWYGSTPTTPPSTLLPDGDHTQDVYADQLATGWFDWSWGGTVDTRAADQVFEGNYALKADLDPWGAISFQTGGFDARSFEWLVFYLYSAAEVGPQLEVYLETTGGVRLPAAPVFDCRFTTGGTLAPGTWQRVRIPLGELDPDELLIGRLTIQETQGEDPAAFWLDQLEFLGAKAPTDWVFLPALQRD